MALFKALVEIFGGLVLFLYGIHFLSEGLEQVAGSKLQEMLEKLTNNPLKGSLFGACATALLQSSSLLMVTMIGLINANLLTLEQAIGVMLGQEIGTTMTAQLVAFKMGDFFFAFLIGGFILFSFFKEKRYNLAGKIFFAIGIIFLGMGIMSSGAGSIKDNPFFFALLVRFSQNLLLALLAGAVFTAIIQSSSAMTGLVIAMGVAGTINLPVAIALIFGANIGTCITGFLASLKSCTTSKRASFAQIFINIGGVLIFLPFIIPFSQLVLLTSSQLPRQIANAHALFNIMVSVIMFPFIKPLVRLLEWAIPGETQKKIRKTLFIDDNLLNVPFLALSKAEDEVNRLSMIAYTMLEETDKAFLQRNTKAAKKAYEKEPLIDELANIIEAFLDRIPDNQLSEEERKKLNRLKSTIVDIERVGDLSYNLVEFSQKMIEEKITLSPKAHEEVTLFFGKVRQCYKLAVRSIKEGSEAVSAQVVGMENEIDNLEKQFKENHIHRLRNKVCNPKADTIFIETLRNLERIGDHSDNIGRASRF
ncbi:sodium:solute symporter [Candidatus Woesearchaeota archaeon CG_4_10_14_0_8_um_filter_47_5]|nr:MAG: sodium:solute symporter [Candidatus Woesearchaeota archaeon CG_4_10_14_0_8_um_filter_47_5]